MQPRTSHVVVIGAGTMGTQIGSAFALAGFSVNIVDVAPEALERSESEARQRLSRLAEKGAIADPASAIGRMGWVSNLREAAAGADLVVEAATERLDVKRSLFRAVGEAAPEHAIIVTNSSTIPSSHLAQESGRPAKVCNMHFFNPALVMACVEVVPHPETSTETIAEVTAIVDRLGKQAVQLRREVPGFIANRLMMAIQDEAVRLYADGVADIEDIDRAAVLALGHPLGPFALMDLVGLDVIKMMHDAEWDMSAGTSEPAHPELVSRIDAGQLGRKSGAGWFDYDGGGR